MYVTAFPAGFLLPGIAKFGFLPQRHLLPVGTGHSNMRNRPAGYIKTVSTPFLTVIVPWSRPPRTVCRQRVASRAFPNVSRDSLLASDASPVPRDAQVVVLGA